MEKINVGETFGKYMGEYLKEIVKEFLSGSLTVKIQGSLKKFLQYFPINFLKKTFNTYLRKVSLAFSKKLLNKSRLDLYMFELLKMSLEDFL